MSKIRVYISGGITGVDDYERKFELAEKHLISEGFNVINPAKYNKCLAGLSYEEFMKIDMTLLDMCDYIYICLKAGSAAVEVTGNMVMHWPRI